jgi:hypothetical protein
MSEKSFQYGKSNANPKIAMPSEGEISAIDRLTTPGNQESVSVAPAGQQSVFASVPAELPEETRQYIESTRQEEDTEELDEIGEAEEIEEVVQPAVKVKEGANSFSELRNAKEKAERERDALMAQWLASQQQNQPKKSVEIEEDYDINIGDDDLADGKVVRKVDARTRALEKKLAQMEAQSREMAAESRVRAKCPDIDSIVTDENIYLLRQNYPEVAQSLAVAPDNWDKLASVYTMIKTLGIHKTRSYESDKVAAVKNIKKPRPMASISPQQGESPLSGVNAFVTDFKMTKEAQKNTWKEMQEAMKKS